MAELLSAGGAIISKRSAGKVINLTINRYYWKKLSTIQQISKLFLSLVVTYYGMLAIFLA